MFLRAFLGGCLLAASTCGAMAHGHHRIIHHRFLHRVTSDAPSYEGWTAWWSAPPSPAAPFLRAKARGLGPRPAAWCGWEMRQLVGSDPGPSYNLARNWAHWGRPGAPGIGAVVVWPHHVGKIVGQVNGEWVIESGNDGHALRTRARSIGGAIAIRWG